MSARTVFRLFPGPRLRGPPMEASVLGSAHLLAHRAGAPTTALAESALTKVRRLMEDVDAVMVISCCDIVKV